MHLATLLASATALLATVSGAPSPATDAQAFNLNASTVETQPKVRIFNRCPYKVYLWSVLTGMDCPSEEGAVLESGGFYQENFRPAVGRTGTSIKLSKIPTCDKERLLQLEYFIETTKPGYNYNYLDVSYVDALETRACPTCPLLPRDCPTCTEGFYLKSGNEDGQFAATADNSICPILSCNDWESCSKVAYVGAFDVQTRSCDPNANLDFYMCGGEAPGAEPPSVPNVPDVPSARSSAPVEKPSSVVAPSSAAVDVDVVAAAVTAAPVQNKPRPVHIKTETVFVTEIAYVNAKKRHEHGHRHQHFHA